MSSKQQIFLQKIEDHKGILIKVAKMYMDTYQDEEDLKQEIIFQLWKYYDKFEERSKFSTWMYRVAINTAITFLRKEKRRTDKYAISSENTTVATEYDDTQEKQLAHFYKAVKQLNKIEKALILLFIEGNSHKEIGENLGITEVNARVKLNRTKNKLQKIIKSQGYEF